MQFTYQTFSTLVAFVLFTSVTAAPVSEVSEVSEISEVTGVSAGAVAWADPKDCHRFYECPAGGTPVLKTCGPGTAFQAQYSICDYESKVASCWHH
jgi:hypothetical protein